MTIAYEYGDALYLNITNECPCDCVFCIRDRGDGINPGQSLRLDHEPSIDEIKEALAKVDFSKYREIVFCGYGEPTYRLTVLLETAKYLKGTQSLPIRLNTNGLSDLINKAMIKTTAPLLAGYIDHVSISLNAPDNQYYRDLCNPIYGDKAYDALLVFARECKDYVPQVTFSVLGSALEEGVLEKCQAICDSMDIPLRVR